MLATRTRSEGGGLTPTAGMAILGSWVRPSQHTTELLEPLYPHLSTRDPSRPRNVATSPSLFHT